MACKCCPALVAMRDEANRLWPHRDKASDGCCGDAAHAARKSDHNPDKDGMATALDLDHDPGNGPDCAYWSEQIRLRKDPRCKYLIFRGRMFASYSVPGRPAWEWGPYTGVNAHKQHMHVSVTQQAKRVIGPWFFTTEEDDMAQVPQDEWEQVKAAVLRMAPVVDKLDDNANFRMDALRASMESMFGRLQQDARNVRTGALSKIAEWLGKTYEPPGG